ncbi:hypothetical protein ACFL0W_03865 [Nanoarchaeota archaeon]
MLKKWNCICGYKRDDDTILDNCPKCGIYKYHLKKPDYKESLVLDE